MPEVVKNTKIVVVRMFKICTKKGVNNDYICLHLLNSNKNGGIVMEENNNNIVIYQTDDGTTKIDVKLEDETV